MNKSRTFITAAITTAVLVVGYSAHVIATVVSGQNASATIVAPIVVTPGTALTFGTVSNDPNLASSVTINPTTNVALGANGASVLAGATRADFGLAAGAANSGATYTVNFTAVPGDISNSNVVCAPACPANSVEINTLTWDSLGTGTLDGAGNDTMWVGGTLSMSTAAVGGSYSGTYDMDVVYN